MSDMYCPTCKEFKMYPDRHVCSPAWEIWRDDETREDSRTVYGISAERAVEKWAQRSDSDGDYTIVSGSPATVCIAKLGEDEVKYIRVEGCNVPEYTARAMDEDQVKLLLDWNQNHPKGTKIKITMDIRLPPAYDKTGETELFTETTSLAYFDCDGYAEVRVQGRPYEAHLDKIKVTEQKGATR